MTSALPALVTYTLRACLPGRRRAGLLLPAFGAVFFGMLAHAIGDRESHEAFASVASAGIFGIVLPIGCLVVGDAVLGAEVRSGTLHFTWLSPVSRFAIVVGRWMAGTLVAGATLGAASVLAALFAGVPDMAAAMALSVVAGSAAYVAVFVLVGAVAKRAVVWSLVVVVLIERLLGAALDGIAQLSPGWLARASFAGLADAPTLLRSGVPEGPAAVWRLLVVTAISLALAAWRLSHLRVVGQAD